MIREPILIIAEIIKDFLGLAANRVFIYEENINLPKDKDLYIAIQHINSQPYSLTNRQTPTETGFQEEINLLTREEYIINVVSKNNEARTRKEEVILALNSSKSLELQEKYQFNIAKITSSFINISELEGAGILKRYAIKIVIMAHKSKINEIDYYDNNFITNLETD